MKNRFAEYYELPKERIKEIWENSLIVFDTNVLLNLYRYDEDTRTEFINVIKFYKERLWIPYQVGLEFHRRREDILRKNAAAYTTLGEKLTEQLVKAVSTLESEYSRHPYINIKDIRSKVERCASSIKKSLYKQAENHPDYSKEDKILNAITVLFDGRVGEDFAEKELDALYKEGEKRYANDIPPGYCDEKNKKEKGKRSLYGDLIVWKQTINHCKELSKNVIFITDDHKPDWWVKADGKNTPRKELIKEFADSTGQSIIIYDSRRFLKYAKDNKVKVSAKTIREVEADNKKQNEEREYVDLLSHLEVIRKFPRFVNNDTFLDFDSVRKIKEITDSCKYTTSFEDVARSLYEPASLSNFRELSHKLKDFRETVDSMGGFREIQRKIQELSELTSFTRSKDSKENLVPTNSLEQATQ